MLVSVWSFGVILYELATGQDLFQKGLSQDVMVKKTDREKLLSWKELSIHNLDLVFEQALQEGTITGLSGQKLTQSQQRARQFAAQDLIAVRT